MIEIRLKLDGDSAVGILKKIGAIVKEKDGDIQYRDVLSKDIEESVHSLATMEMLKQSVGK